MDEYNTAQIIPDYDYTKDDYLNTLEPYKKLYELHSSPFLYGLALKKMAANAKEVGVTGFKDLVKRYNEAENSARRKNLVLNQTEFDGQFQELTCGEWIATDNGIFRDLPNGGRECACAHPIMPQERVVNIDTGEVKLTLAYRPPGYGKRWRTTVVGKSVVSTARSITALSSQGISVTSSSASALVDYLNDIENLNYDLIPERKSIGRLGYIEGEGFSPYVDGLVFDGDESYRFLYSYVREHGSQTEWLATALECRKMSVTARIMLAASFASPILSVVGSLPFFVHLWGGSETGKTVALMLAASVWGDPLKGRFVQTFNATRVGQELTAAFLNHLPMCIDELQLTKNGKGQSNFDVYQLAEGVGRTRGKKTGGVEMTPTWDCCFLTTGEDPIISGSAGGGAVNRVIEIECFTGQKVIEDGPRISASLKRNFGWAGRKFVESLYSSEEMLEHVRKVYREYYEGLNKSGSTDKQSLAAAAILTADELATAWIFDDDMDLTVSEIAEFLASRESVSAGARAYEWILDWISENQNHFYWGGNEPVGSTYGMYDDDFAYINPKSIRDALNDAGFNYKSTMSYLRTKGLLLARSSNEFTKSKRFPDGTNTGKLWIRLRNEADEGIPDDLL